MAGGERNGEGGKPWHWCRILLILPFLGVLSVPFYNSIEPVLFDLPFFYWYQMLWVVLCAAIISVVYLVER
jgi:hypothetical protein